MWERRVQSTEAESKEKHGVWDPMPELTITLPYVDSYTFTMGSPMPESTLNLCQSRLYPPVRDLWFGFSAPSLSSINRFIVTRLTTNTLTPPPPPATVLQLQFGNFLRRRAFALASNFLHAQDILRPYLINFGATGSPCRELTSWDNSSSMSIWLGRKESHFEDILPVSSTDGAAISPTISLALSLWYTSNGGQGYFVC